MRIQVADASVVPETILGFGSQDSDFGFRVSGRGIRVSGLGIRVSGRGVQVSGLGSRCSGLGVRVSCFGSRVWCFESPVSGSGLGFLILGVPKVAAGAPASSGIIQAADGLVVVLVRLAFLLWYRGGLVFEAHRLMYHSA